jgi:ribonuclease III
VRFAQPLTLWPPCKQRLQHQFRDPRLLQQALTHRSFSADHNERLEFLGDSVLNLAVATFALRASVHVPEGDLSRVRANLVKQDTLHQLAVVLGLPMLLKLGEGEARSGGHKRPSILADALEAVIGALYLDAALTLLRPWCAGFCKDVDITPRMPAMGKDPKTELQEWLQGRKMNLPIYRVVGTSGAAHQQTFDVECEVLSWPAPSAALALPAAPASKRPPAPCWPLSRPFDRPVSPAALS